MISPELALDAFNQLLAEQTQKQQPISMALCDKHGELQVFVRMAGASLHSGVLAQNKAYTAARDRQTTADLGAWSRSSGRTLDNWSDARFTGFGGGVPVWRDGHVVGAVGVSGLSEEEDVQVAEQLIRRLVKGTL